MGANLLSQLYERCSTQLDAIGADWEIIFVDDASPDKSWESLCTLHEIYPKVKVIQLAFNHGQQHATLCGLGYASKDFIITIDDDLQCFPEDIPLFIDKLQSGKQVVIGSIVNSNKQHLWWRNLGSRINQWLAGKVIGKPTAIGLSSFRAMTQVVAQRLTQYKGAHPHIAALIFKSVPHKYIVNVPIRHAPRLDGIHSSYSFPKLVKTLSYLLINNSYMPLRFIIGWGFFISFLSFSYALFVFAQVVFSDYAVPGWASLAVLISFLCGNILLALGVLGEYLGRLVEEASRINQFSVFDERL
jgi:glycosyltransferase involved in cell wall biosynthesis